MRRYLASLAAAGLILAVTGSAGANTVASSTIYFRGILTQDIDGVGYTGVLRCVDEAAEDEASLARGDGVSGFDIYCKEGATAWYGNDPSTGPVWSPVTIADHDPYPAGSPDTPDWYQYSLAFSKDDGGQYRWALRNHAGATAADPWYNDPVKYPARGVPMSGVMDWATGIATETDVGAYLASMGTPEIPGGAASQGGGAGYWDMDWSWGSEAWPLQYDTFKVTDKGLGSAENVFSLTPIPEPLTMLAVFLGVAGLGGYIRKRQLP